MRLLRDQPRDLAAVRSHFTKPYLSPPLPGRHLPVGLACGNPQSVIRAASLRPPLNVAVTAVRRSDQRR